MKYIDIHTHIAYGLDDGAKTKEETIAFLEAAKKQGYEGIVLTPHINDSTIDMYEEIYGRYLEIKELTDLELYLGNEILLNDHVIDLLKAKQFYTMNASKYILIECDLRQSYRHMLDSLETHLNSILNMGYIPIIAHIERYYKDEIDLDDAEYFIQKGCLIQINTTSILSTYKKVQPLLDGQYVHFIASDAHDLKRRNLNMDEVYQILKKKGYDDTYLKDMMYIYPKTILQNKEIVVKTYKKRSILQKIINK